MQLNTANEPRAFEMIKTVAGTDHMLPLKVRQLTLRQLKQVGERVAEHIKADRRKEFLAVAAEVPAKERTAFLVASARANTSVDQADLAEAADTLWGVLNVLATATDLTLEELQALADNPMNMEQLDMARYYALGLDIDKLMADIDALDTETEVQATKAEATFPVGEAG